MSCNASGSRIQINDGQVIPGPDTAVCYRSSEWIEPALLQLHPPRSLTSAQGAVIMTWNSLCLWVCDYWFCLFQSQVNESSQIMQTQRQLHVQGTRLLHWTATPAAFVFFISSPHLLVITSSFPFPPSFSPAVPVSAGTVGRGAGFALRFHTPPSLLHWVVGD